MPLFSRTSVLLAGSALIVCAVAAQEAQHSSVNGREFRIYDIFLPGIPGKPTFIKTTVEHIESIDGTKVVTKHWEEEMARDKEGRVWGRLRAARESYPGKVPPVEIVWLYDAAAENEVFCDVGGHCWSQEIPPSFWAFFRGCGENELVRTFLGESSIGGISMGRTRIMCYRPDGSSGGEDQWHNSEFNVDFNVVDMPLQKGASYYRIDQVSPSVPDDPELFQVPPSGYTFHKE
jgi:hypothetical protein